MSTLDERELDRLREAAALDLGADVDDPALRALVERAAHELGLPIAAVSIVLDSAQYFVASHGIDGWMGAARGTPVEWSFCRHAVARGATFLVEDAKGHELVDDNPLVEHDGIRSYLGVPLTSARGQAIGALCVIGTEARRFTQADQDRLRELADAVMSRLETRRE